MRRLGLDVYRLDLRVRAFTGYAFACLLLIAGFFVAGVPLGEPQVEPVASVDDETPVTVAGDAVPSPEEDQPAAPMTTTVAITGTATITRPSSGAFGGVPTREEPTLDAENDEVEGSEGEGVETTPVATPDIPTPTDEGEPGEPTVEGEEAAAATATPTRVTTDTPTPTWTPSPTPTPSQTPTSTPTPTFTPTPTLTPTPVEGETAVVDSDGANIWLYRSPGGQELELVSHGQTLLVLSRRANQGGALWREVQTLEGEAGWIEERFLDYGDGG
ncbi:MAG TPA: hypothetical protein VK879_15795 [Candidatus Sulfomarinibacteraceae bacterium]|nr:hypothetical protein [Candidatus Sulfomarinibacteraceae bacterium]